MSYGAPQERIADQSLSWSACRSSSVAFATSWLSLMCTSGRACWTDELDRLTELPLPNFGRGILTRCTSLSHDSMVRLLLRHAATKPKKWFLLIKAPPAYRVTVIETGRGRGLGTLGSRFRGTRLVSGQMVRKERLFLTGTDLLRCKYV